MRFFIRRACAIALCFAASVCAPGAIAAPTVTTIRSFDGTSWIWPIAGDVDGSLFVLRGAALDRLALDGTMTLIANINFDWNKYGGFTSVIRAADGDFYGVTYGVQGLSGGSDGGAAIRIPANGGPTVTLASFADIGEAAPWSLVQAQDGNFYGVAQYGGANGCGAVFQLTSAGKLTEVAALDGSTGCGPTALAAGVGSDNHLYGNSDQGVFQYTFPMAPLKKGSVKLFGGFPRPGAGLGYVVAVDVLGNVYGDTYGADYPFAYQFTRTGSFIELVKKGGISPVTGIDGRVYGTIGGPQMTPSFAVFEGDGHWTSLIDNVNAGIYFQAPDGSFIAEMTSDPRTGAGSVLRIKLDEAFTTLTAQAIVLESAPSTVHLQMKALLKDSSTGQPLAGRKIDFTAPTGAVLCSAYTDSTGTAKCGTPTTYLRTAVNQSYVAHFPGDAAYRPSFASASFLK